MRAIKKMTQNDNGPGQNYGKTDVFTFSKKGYFGPKSAFSKKKNTQDLLKDWYLFVKRVLFLRTILPGRGQDLVSFFWALTLFFWPKNLIFAIRPQILSMICF